MKRRAFTLVELLIVIGIIAVLAGLFLTSGRKAREQANAAICTNNLRQLALAFNAYTMDNDDRFPHYAGPARNPADWVYWRPSNSDVVEYIPERSPIAKYIKADLNRALRCPSDDVSVRRNATPFPYPYSYTMNMRFSSFEPDPTRPRLSRSTVKEPSKKILLIEEAESTMDDGAWDPTQAGNRTGEDYLSTRHFAKQRNPEPTGKLPGRADRNDRGVVAFADGHAEPVTRADTWQPMHYEPRSEAPRDLSR
jgi:prepilin-type N-terminal cleavage/methylation domain-containing protein/prepilin-type processing-associated H-X9-DG protein